VIYGIITVGALLAGESAQRETYPETVGSAIIALLLYWLAHSYADLLGSRLEHDTRLSGAALARAFVHDWAIVRGAAIPLLALLIAWALGATLTDAVNAALWTVVGSLVLFELLAGIGARAAPRELLLEGSVGAAMGLAIVALKVVLH
jgi:hypothetical protein